MDADPATSTSDRPEDHLAAGGFVDSDAPAVREFAERAVGGEDDAVRRAGLLFGAVRDRIWYDPFRISTDPHDYRASSVAVAPRNWCVPKAVLLTASARAVGIPARLGFADVRNHLNTPRLRALMNGHDVFVHHGYSELYLDGRWLKASPAFNAELCARFGVEPLDFDGHGHALMHQYTDDGARYMEYVVDHGPSDDLPLDAILTRFRAVYGEALLGGDPHAGSDEFSAPTS
ncbi:transglutaminase-like domain [Pseudonocardia sp. N23]|nr:transglutaminase-like domain [Pseudonocardia sp. N23]